MDINWKGRQGLSEGSHEEMRNGVRDGVLEDSRFSEGCQGETRRLRFPRKNTGELNAISMNRSGNLEEKTQEQA